MDSLNIIEYGVFFTVAIYAFGLILVWIYEIKLSFLYKDYQKNLQFIRKLNISMAVLHAKMFKFENDYRRGREELDRRQQLILKLMMINRKFIENKKRLSLFGS